MKKSEYAASKGITVEQLNSEMYEFYQCEGFDSDGNEYETLDDWLGREKNSIFEPFHKSEDIDN